MTSTMWTILPADFLGGFVSAGQTMVSSIVTMIIDFGMLAGIILALIGVIVHFGHYSHNGLRYLVDGIIVIIVVTCIYMALFGASGPPDLSAFFKVAG